MLLAAYAKCILTAGIERNRQHGIVLAECALMFGNRLPRNLVDSDAFNIARGAGEILLHEGRVEANRLENLGTTIRLISRYAHFRHDLVEAFADRLDVVLDSVRRIHLQARGNIAQGVHGQPRMNRLRTVAGEQGKVMCFPRRTGTDHQPGAGAQALAYEMMMYTGGSEQYRNGDSRGTGVGVRQNQDIYALLDSTLCRLEQGFHCRLHALRARHCRIGDIENPALEFSFSQFFYIHQARVIIVIEHGLGHLEPVADVLFVDAEQIGLRADKRDQRHHQFFPNRVDRRIGNLSKQLLEIVVKRLVLARQDRQRRIVAHRANGLLGTLGHGSEDELDVLLAESERLLQVEKVFAALKRRLARTKLRQVDPRLFDVGRIVFGRTQLFLHLGIVDDALPLGVDQQHLARLKSPLLSDVFFRHG